MRNRVTVWASPTPLHDVVSKLKAIVAQKIGRAAQVVHDETLDHSLCVDVASPGTPAAPRRTAEALV